jgi:hypothetical protein
MDLRGKQSYCQGIDDPVDLRVNQQGHIRKHKVTFGVRQLCLFLWYQGFFMKRVLVINYSQTGQLTKIVKSFTTLLRENKNIEIVWEELMPIKPYPFPWSFLKFVDVFPESVLMDAPGMKPFSFDLNKKFDLVILSYQVWYLSPSLPITGFLKSPEARVMKETPVITVIGCRDMWLMAQEKVKKCLEQVGAKLIDNVVFVDQGKKMFTFITTPRWLLMGKKEGFWRIFPPAGVSKNDIMDAGRFGKAIVKALERGEIDKRHSILKGLGAVKVNPNNIRFEQAAHRHFLIWGKILRAVGKQGQMRRLPFLILFILFLSGMVLISFPFTVIFNIFVNPLRKEEIAKKVEYFEQPSGSSTERLESRRAIRHRK